MSSSSSPTQANTSNTSSSSTNVRDIGFTGAQAVAAFNNLVNQAGQTNRDQVWAGQRTLTDLGGNVQNTLQTLSSNVTGGLSGLSNVVSNSLGNLSDRSASVAISGLNLSDTVNARTTQSARDLLSATTTSVADILNTARDVSQRSIAAGLNQAAPITDVPAAGASTQTQTVLIIAAAAVVLIFAIKG